MTEKNIFLFGYSGHALVVADCASHEFELSGYFDHKKNDNDPHKLIYHGQEKNVNVQDIVKSSSVFPSVGSNDIRQRIVQYFRMNEMNETTIIHTTAFISKYSIIGKSSMAGPNAIVNSNSRIGDGVIINSGAIVEHDCEIGDFVHIAPGAILAGNVKVGELSFIGAGAVIKEGVSIGENVIIGAGSIVLKDIGDNEKWVGNPARRIDKNV